MALSEPSALAGLRVLDLTDLKGHLCARLLADMGADVIKIEPPGGDGARNVGPFVDDRPHRDRSLFFWFYNLNKRSMTLDLRHPEGAAVLRRLAEGADVVIESFKPGEMARMGLGWEVLHALNPALVLCSIAPFGQSGLYSGYAADDSVLTALSGMLYVMASRTARPCARSACRPTTRRHTTARSPPCARFWPATASGEDQWQGQWIDLSMQEATASAVEHVAAGFFGTGEIERRRGTLHWSRFFRVGRCRDGHVMHCTLGDWTSLVEWVKGDGKARNLTTDLTAPEWEDVAKRRADAEQLFDVLDEWVKDYSRDELLERAQLLRLPYASVRKPEDLFDDEQLLARGYFHEVEHPELGRTFRYPGAPYLFTGSPWRVTRRPPLVGEHTGEILGGELGLGTEELAALAAEGVI